MTDEPTDLAQYAAKKGTPWLGLGTLLSGNQGGSPSKPLPEEPEILITDDKAEETHRISDLLHQPLRAVSNVIELKPDGKYLLVFKGDFTQNQLARAKDMIRAQGIEQIVAISLREGQELEVLEIADR